MKPLCLGIFYFEPKTYVELKIVVDVFCGL